MDNSGLCSFIKQPYRRKYLDNYFRQFSKDKTDVLFDDNVAAPLQEQGFSIPDEPRSIYRVDKLYEWLAKFSPERSPTIDMNDIHIQNGILLAKKVFSRPKEEPELHLSEFSPKFILSITSNRKGSPGLTAWGQRKAESYTRAYERGVQTLKDEKAPEPCLAFARTQKNEKTRLVWGFPYSMTAIEGLFARPLIDKYLKLDTAMAFGKSTGNLGCHLRTSSYRKQYCYATDMSSFDSSIGSQLIKMAFKILSSWFNLNQDIKIADGTTIPAKDVWYKMVHYFIHTPIVMPDGNIYKGKRHGVPSGSYFTQMIDSVVNVIIVGTISHRFNLFVDKQDIMVLGDDVIFWSNRDITLEKIAKYASDTFRAVFNPTKCGKYTFRDVIHYLGRDWDHGVPDLPEADILARMTQPERFRKYSKDPVIRARQVRLLLLSYAAVYRSAYRIAMQSMQAGRWYKQKNSDFEHWMKGSIIKREDLDRWAEEHGNGLLRFTMRYKPKDPDMMVSSETSVANQFWS